MKLSSREAAAVFRKPDPAGTGLLIYGEDTMRVALRRQEVIAALIGPDVPMATCAHPLHEAADAFNPNVVKVVLDKLGRAMYFSRATIPWDRDGFALSREALPHGCQPLRHIGLYAYSNAFLQTYPGLEASPLEAIEALEQLRVLWHGYPIAVHVTDSAPAAGVDTPEDLERVRVFFPL